MKKLTMSVLMALLAAGCSSKPVHEAREIDTKLDLKGTVGDSKIGINDKNEMIVQEEIAIENEMRDIRWRTYDTERLIAYNYDQLDRCTTELADPRLGGSGEVVEIPERDVTKDSSKIRESLGLTETQELRIVRKEYLTDRLTRERKFEEQLSALSKHVEKAKVKCERQLGYARLRVGLPAKRMTAQGYINKDGSWTTLRHGEKNLDDAFEIASRNPQYVEQARPVVVRQAPMPASEIAPQSEKPSQPARGVASEEPKKPEAVPPKVESAKAEPQPQQPEAKKEEQTAKAEEPKPKEEDKPKVEEAKNDAPKPEPTPTASAAPVATATTTPEAAPQTQDVAEVKAQ